MQPVLNFAALTASLKAKGQRWRVAVVCGTDRATLEALMRGTAEGLGLAFEDGREKDGWACIKCRRQA